MGEPPLNLPALATITTARKALPFSKELRSHSETEFVKTKQHRIDHHQHWSGYYIEPPENWAMPLQRASGQPTMSTSLSHT